MRIITTVNPTTPHTTPHPPQCVLDLRRHVLEIGSAGIAVPFLAEKDLPKSARGHVADSQPSDDADPALAAALKESASSGGASAMNVEDSKPAAPAPAPALAPASATATATMEASSAAAATGGNGGGGAAVRVCFEFEMMVGRSPASPGLTE